MENREDARACDPVGEGGCHGVSQGNFLPTLSALSPNPSYVAKAKVDGRRSNTRPRVAIKSARENLTTSNHFQELSSLTIG